MCGALSIKLSLLLSLASVTASAQPGLTTIRVSKETAPAGGIAQIKVTVTSPMPISSGLMDLDFSRVSFDSIDGISLFSSGGDAVGAATVTNGKVNLRFSSPKGTFGLANEYPILTIAVRVSPNAIPGQTFPVILNPQASIWRDILGSAIPFEFHQGSITVAGSVSIDDVLPGGGLIPAGVPFSVIGTGFNPGTRVQLNGVVGYSAEYAGPSEFRVTLAEDRVLDGTQIRARNADGVRVDYYSYMRGVPQGESTRALLNQTVPSFSTARLTEAILLTAADPAGDASSFTAIAIQNPDPSMADVTVEVRSSAGGLLGSSQLTLPSRGRITRDLTELTGEDVPADGYVRIVSSIPVQALGMLANERSGVVAPISLSVIRGPEPLTLPQAGEDEIESESGRGGTKRGKEDKADNSGSGRR